MLLGDTQRLSKIDKLHELRLDKYVSLPMLVVGGDQSSGKSSVLEGLTGLPFPRDSSLCTRFPTSIVFKRLNEARITASVIPYDKSSEHESEVISTLQGCKMGDSDLLDIFEKAGQAMGLPPLSDDTQGRAFSKDMLKIEMASPDFEHFSVVDLPGLFRSKTAFISSRFQITQTNIQRRRNTWSYYGERHDVREADDDGIHGQSKEHHSVRADSRSSSKELTKDRAVVPANADIATQEVVQMALRTDPKTIRTLGVFTKPDLVDKGAEHGILKLLSGAAASSQLGYHVVCNRSQENLSVSLSQRNISEKAFFASRSPWTQVAPDRAGIESLKRRLNDLSVDATRRSYDDLRKEMAGEFDDCTESLTKPGPDISTDSDRRQHLLRTMTDFQFKTRDARDAMYERDACFDNPNLRLATNIADRLDQFNIAVARDGLLYRFKAQSHDTTGTSSGEEADDEEAADGSTDGEDTSQMDICSWIRHEYRSTRGFEIGTVNPSVLPRLFKKQVEKWPQLARSLMEDLVRSAKQFATDLISIVCLEDPVRVKLQQYLQAPIAAGLNAFSARMNQVMEVEFQGGPYTLNHYLSTELNRVRGARYRSRLNRQDSWSAPNGSKDTLVRLNDVINLNKSNEDQAVDDLHDSLKAYCKVARKRFVDNIVRTAKYYLLESSTGPLQNCSAEYIGTLTSEELEDIIQDDPLRRATRVALKQKHAALKEGLAILC